MTRASWLEDDGIVIAPEREGPIVVGREAELAAAAAFVDARPAHACALLRPGGRDRWERQLPLNHLRTNPLATMPTTDYDLWRE